MEMIESGWVKAGTINTHFLVGGQGSPLVLVGGGGAAGAETEWAANISALAQHYRVYAPDLVGRGKTDKPRADYTKRFFDTFFDDFVAATGLQRMSLVGHSLGGGIALAFTMNHPERVEKLVLIGSSGLANTVTILGRLLLAVFKMVARVTKDQAYLSLVSGGGKREPHEVFMDRLSELRSPTLLCWGEWDGYVPVKLAYQAHRRIRNSQLHVFKRGWHAPHRERAEEFNRVVLDFLGR